MGTYLLQEWHKHLFLMETAHFNIRKLHRVDVYKMETANGIVTSNDWLLGVSI